MTPCSIVRLPPAYCREEGRNLYGPITAMAMTMTTAAIPPQQCYLWEFIAKHKFKQDLSGIIADTNRNFRKCKGCIRGDFQMHE